MTDLDVSGLSIALYVVVAAVAVFTIVMIVLFGSRARARRRMKRGTKQLVDRELVTVTGIVRPAGPPLVAPLSGSPCIAHHSRARLFANQHSTQVTDEPAELELTGFILETPQGRIAIDVERAELEAVPSPVVGRSKERELGFLARHGFSAARHADAGFDEIVVKLGELVTVHGMVIIEADPSDGSERGFRDPAKTRIRIVAPVDQPIVIAPT